MEQDRPYSKGLFNCYNHKWSRLRTRIRLVLVNINSITISKTALILFVVVVWISNQLLTFFSLFDDKRITLLSTLSKIDCKLIQMNESFLTETLLFRNWLFFLKKSTLILNGPIGYILSTEKFEETLLNMFE